MFQFPSAAGALIARTALLAALCLAAPVPLSVAEDAHDHSEEEEADGHGGESPVAAGHGDEEGQPHDHARHEPPGLELSVGQQRSLEIGTERLEYRTIGTMFGAPGEVLLNAYATSQVTPRIEAQVIARHARLGEHVDAGTVLVTLSSVEMAVAQGDLVVAEGEWQRLHKLREGFVSESSYLEASVARQKARSRVRAFGMTPAQVDALIQAASEKADGTFELLAPQAGTVIRDDFVLGELVEPGRVLFEITDESVRWVEARMPPEEAAQVAVGDLARVGFRDAWLEGRVTQIHHLLDEATRTQGVRVEVPDPGHRLHPGVFVDVVVVAAEGESVLALPESAVLRGTDGHWQVFVVTGDRRFVPREVTLERTAAGLAVIDGLPAGTEVVTDGAFFLASELAKGGFDPHSH